MEDKEKESKKQQISSINFIIDDGKRKRFKLNVNDFKDNSYYKQNPQMFELLCKELNGKLLFVRKIKKTNVDLIKWIYDVTNKINSNKLTERIYWILTDMHNYPLCKKCHNMLIGRFISINMGYFSYCSNYCRNSDPEIIRKRQQTISAKTPEQKQVEIDKRLATYYRHKKEDLNFVKRMVEKSIATRKKNHGEDYTGRKKCWKTIKDRYGVDNPMQIREVKDNMVQHNLKTYGVEWHIASPEIKEKSRQTCQENYGVDNPFASPEIIHQIRQQNLDNYGVEYSWQREDVKQSIKETNKRLYGYESAMQNPEIRVKTQKNIKYDEKSFDSYPELCLYIWLKDCQFNFEFQPKVSFQYEHNGITHCYCPDFRIGDLYFELKGDQFFKEDGTMQNPYDHAQDSLYEAKHQCMLKHDIVILRSCEYKIFISYVEQTYGKDFYLKIKEQKHNSNK